MLEKNSLFEGLEENFSVNKGKKISVTFAEYKTTETVDPEKVFQGFDE